MSEERMDKYINIITNDKLTIKHKGIISKEKNKDGELWLKSVKNCKNNV